MPIHNLIKQLFPRRDCFRHGWRAAAGVCALLAAVPAAVLAQSSGAQMTTLGGGPLIDGGPSYGFADGNSLSQSQFHTPAGCAVTTNYLYVADRDNNSVRRMDLSAGRTRTLLANLSQPVAVVLDTNSNLYIACQGTGEIVKSDRFGNVSTLAWLVGPVAMTTDNGNTLFVAEAGGAIKQVSLSSGVVLSVASGFNQPRGIAWLRNGLLAISCSGSHVIQLVDPLTGALARTIGSGTPGFTDGPSAIARFDTPQQIAAAPSGGLVVADRYNHGLRYVDPQGIVTTLCGIDPADWETYPAPGIFPGWADGDTEFAECREPVGVAVATDGTVYDTEVYYHLVRKLSGVTETTSASHAAAPVPVIDPASGFYPMGTLVTVSYPADNLFEPVDVYYTTDGSIPTTNSFKVTLVNGVGTIAWTEANRDLSDLRVMGVVGGVAGEVVQGVKPSTSQIGIPGNINAGVGSAVVVPVVVNLASNVNLRSLQFRVEVTPETADAPAISDGLQVLSITNSTFIPLAGPVSDAANPAIYFTSSYLNGRTRGLTVSYIGTNSTFFINSFGEAAMLVVPVPAGAFTGQRYRVDVLQASGATDANQGVAFKINDPSYITVTNTVYKVGDTASARWYEAGAFGDGSLNNDDVNNVFYAAMGVKEPFPFTDAFDAMDAFPLDSGGMAGGDGMIRYMDWVVILRRSLGLDSDKVYRSWGAGGVRVSPAAGSGLRLASRQTVTAEQSQAWFCEATLGALPVENAQAGGVVNMPVYLKAEPGCNVSGLMFRAAVTPAISGDISFKPAPGLAAPVKSEPLSDTASSEILCGWVMPAFNPSLTGSNLLGWLQFALPAGTASAAAYQVHFTHVDASPMAIMPADYVQYNLQSLPGDVWVGTSAQAPRAVISDEWKLKFFGCLADSAASPDNDSDGDGFTNLMEFNSGTNPTQVDWRFKMGLDGFAVRWYAEAGKQYVVEHSSDLQQWTAAGETVTGEGRLTEYRETAGAVQTQYYRVRPAN
jgi:hypothetical protein